MSLINIDILIVVVFLITNLWIGLKYGRSVKNIKDYALGGRNFSTAALVATIIATWVGGSTFFITLSKTYTDGLYYVVAACGMGLSFFFTAFYLIPRMGEFIGNTSIAESMGNLYGKNIRIITAIAGCIGATGFIAVQFKAFSNIFSYFFKFSDHHALLLGGAIVTIYSAFRGMKAIAYTDVLQFITFAFVIPVISMIIWDSSDFSITVLSKAMQEPKFNYHEVFNYNNPKLLSIIVLALYYAIPGMEPEFCQRIAIGKNVYQVRKAFIISGFILILIILAIAWIPFLLYTINPNLQSSELLSYIIDNYTYTGLKGMIIIGILSLAISTADANMNASAVLFANDFCKPFGINFVNELILSRSFSVISGIIALFLASSKTDLLSIVLTAQSFYMPIVTVPLMLAIFGFRSTAKAVSIGMIAGFATVISWFFLDTDVDCIIPAMIVNLVFFIGSHYLLKQSGGWVGIKDRMLLDTLKLKRKRKINHIIKFIKTFNLIKFCKINSPNNDATYSLFGIFCFVSTIATIYSTHDYSMKQYSKVLLVVYQSMLIISTCFMLYPMWSSRIKIKTVIGIIWNVTLVYMLTFCSTFFVLLSSFGKFQLVVFTLNMLVILILASWRVAITMMFVGFACSIQIYKYYVGVDSLNFTIENGYSDVIYVLLLISTALITLFKPKQEKEERVEVKIDYLGTQIMDRERELENSLKLKHEFLANLEHEGHTPISSIVGMGEVLWHSYDKLNDKQIRDGLEIIAKSSDRLLSFINNLINVSKLSSMTYQLNKTEVNLSARVYDRLDHCKELYLDNKELEFFTDKIKDNIKIQCDLHYITSTLDNLIINAIKYSTKGKIALTLQASESSLQFTISDEGIAIPKEELLTIFDPFTVGSRIRTKSGDIPNGHRGIGLTLCNLAIKAHGGEISAESDGQKGSIFKFTLPLTT
jgi:Na+/proline symporter/signal transduction histidine kinase